MKVLIGCISFKNLTGSELYVFELAKHLALLNCDVTIASLVKDSPLIEKVKEFNIKTVFLQDLHKNEKWDIIQTQHLPVTKYLCELYPDIKKIYTIHSEIIEVENPYVHYSIVKYIAIRPEIKKYLIDEFSIDENQIEIIYNPIDESRFYEANTKQYNTTLFVGTLNDIRKYMLFDLVDYTKQTGKLLWLVGTNHDTYLSTLLKNDHVKHTNSTNKIEEYYQRCSETAGIMLGRTTIEGWMCNKPGWIYNVDITGKIIDKKFTTPPSDINKFYAKNVANKFLDLFKKVL